MKNKTINILTVLVILPILFLALVFHVEAMPDGYVNTFTTANNNSCKKGKVSVNGECSAVEDSAMDVENRVYVDDCLSCADWGVNYEGCGKYVTKQYQTEMTHTPLTDLHAQCKYPVVYYRTTKGYSTVLPKNSNEWGARIPSTDNNGTEFAKIYDKAILTKRNDRYVAYNRCDTIEDIVHTECTFIHGSACVECAGTHCCAGHYHETGGGVNGTEPYCDKDDCPNHICTGVDKGGNAVTSDCAEVDSCGECYTLTNNDKWIEAHKDAGDKIAKWVCGAMPEDTVNASCDTTYGVKYDVDICTEPKVKTSNYVCQKKYKMRVGDNLVDAYCVNPEYATAGDVEPDDTFDVTTCNTSNSITNCGYANILIEGYLRKELGEYNGKDYYSIISQALQLWGAHVNEAGYNGIGMSPESIAYKNVVATLDIPDLPKDRCSLDFKEKYEKATKFKIGIDVTPLDDYQNEYYRNYGEFMYTSKSEDNRFYRNIFRETENNLKEYFADNYDNLYDVESNVTEIKVEGGKLKGNINQKGLKSVNCENLKSGSKLLMGLCTQNSIDNLSSYKNTDYLEALYLFINTVQGNRDMVNHLFELIAYKDNSESVTVDTLKAVNNPTDIDVTVAENSSILITYKIANNGKDMKCVEGATYNNSPVCCSRDSAGNACVVDQKSIEIVSGSKKQKITSGIDKYDYCTDNGYCYLKVNVNTFSSSELCNADANFVINMQVLSSKSAIKRYESKGSQSDRQSYFVLDYSHNSKDKTKLADVRAKISCIGCTESASINTGYVITPEQAKTAGFNTPKEACLQGSPLTYYDDETDICYAIVENSKNEGTHSNQCINCIVDSHGGCATNNGNIVMVDDSINVRKISDPSLNCIVNMSYNAIDDKSKSFYDYSEIFGVNTDVCKIYCSDEVNIFLANKKDVYVGMHLQYDIESLVEKAYSTTPKTNRAAIFDANKNKQFYNHGGSNDSNDKLMLSAIVMQERKCVSKIFFDEEYDSSRDWETKYRLGDAPDVNNWKTLYNALSEKARSENERREILNQLLYDLYNCNLLNPDEIKSLSGDVVHKPVDRNNVYEYMVEMYKSTADENKDTVTKSGNTIEDHRCVGKLCAGITDETSYTGGAQYIPEYRTDKIRVGETLGEPEITYYSTSNADLPGKKPITVLYCDSDDCFNGANIDGKYYEDYLAFDSIQTDYVENVVGSRFKGSNFSIPTNDYAIFTIQIRTDFYNSEVYQVEHYTGRVKPKDDEKQYVTLRKFIYPVSLDAFQDTTCSLDDETGEPEKGRCKTQFSFTVNPDKTRKSTNDRFANYLRSGAANAPTKYVCSYLAKSEVVREGIVYRSIKLNDPFPNVDKRAIPTNWMTDIGQSAIDEIKKSSDEINRVSDMYLEYKYTITKQGLNNIRDNYNYGKDVSGEGYVNEESKYNCLKATPKYKYMIDYISDENGTIYVQCESSFLRDLNDGKFEGVTVIKGDGISRYSQENRKFNKTSQEGSGD